LQKRTSAISGIVIYLTSAESGTIPARDWLQLKGRKSTFTALVWKDTPSALFGTHLGAKKWTLSHPSRKNEWSSEIESQPS